MSEPKISLGALFDLHLRLGSFALSANDWAVLIRTVLVWAEEQGFLADAPPQALGPDAVTGDMKIERVAEAMHTTTIPAGPQAEPEGQAARGLDTPAAASDDRRGPEGAETVHPAVDDAPAPPVAGGGASLPEDPAPVAGGATSSPNDPTPVKKGMAPLWTEEEDEKAIAMKLAGHTVAEIATALGRPESGTSFRLYRVLKPRIDAAHSAKVTEERAASRGEDPAEDPPAAPVFLDAARPAWWKEATANLTALGYRRPWTGELDLQLTEDIVRGIKLDVLAADMRIAPVDLRNRWLALKAAMGVRGGEVFPIETQTRLLQILRERVAPAAEAAE